jgi:NAD(P)-dependent dehydrogenase (short-subunit alcohol dehydrogenase family)
VTQGRESDAPLRIGIVGAGRSRNGVGPFLARAFEREGALIVGCSGRDAARAEANAAQLASSLGHSVQSYGDVRSLCASGIDALVVASPAEHHLESLQAAAAIGLPCLCEKPLVDPASVEDAMAAILDFTEAGALLAEHAQWPCLLPALDALYGSAHDGAASRVEMGLSPITGEPRLMAEDSLPHLISMAWAVARPGHGELLTLLEARGEFPSPGRGRIDLALAGPRGRIDATLLVEQHLEQPRPAWFSVDGRRADRRIGEGYKLSFCGNGREVAVEDPLQTLVGQFVRNLRYPASGMRNVQRAAAAHAIAGRLCVYVETIARLFG